MKIKAIILILWMFFLSHLTRWDVSSADVASSLLHAVPILFDISFLSFSMYLYYSSSDIHPKQDFHKQSFPKPASRGVCPAYPHFRQHCV